MLLGVDVGGTFTDAVLFDGRGLHTAKSPTTPDDQSQGVLAAVEAALESAGATPGQVEAFAHGMTVAPTPCSRSAARARHWSPPRASATCSI